MEEITIHLKFSSRENLAQTLENLAKDARAGLGLLQNGVCYDCTTVDLQGCEYQCGPKIKNEEY